MYMESWDQGPRRALTIRKMIFLFFLCRDPVLALACQRQWLVPDCSLRQGAGGTEFICFGSRTCFLRWFYKRSSKKSLTYSPYCPDCSLRQGAGGTEFARFGSRTCFLRWFYKRSQTYFGQKPEEHGFPIKKCCLEVKNNDIWEKCVT